MAADTLLLSARVDLAPTLDSSGKPTGSQAAFPYSTLSASVGEFGAWSFTLVNVGDSYVVPWTGIAFGAFIWVSATSPVRLVATITGGNLDVFCQFYAQALPGNPYPINSLTVFAANQNTVVDVVIGG